MRTEKEIRDRVAELEEISKISNSNLISAMNSKNESEIIYWEKTTMSIIGQIYGMKFSLGDYE